MLITLVRKDLRASRWWAAWIWLLAMGGMLCPQRGRWPGVVEDWSSIASWLLWLALLSIPLLQWWLIGIDPPTGDQRFIATRPVPGGLLLTGKVGALILGGVLPLSLAVIIRLLTAGLGVTAGEALFAAGENARVLFIVLGALALSCVIPIRSLWIGVTGIVLFGWILSTGLIHFVGLRMPTSESELNNIKGLTNAGMIALGFAAWTVVACRYLRTGWRMALPVLAGAGLLAATGTNAWLQHLDSKPPDAPAPAGFQPRLQATRGPSCSLWTSSIVEFRQDCKLVNLPPGIFAEPTLTEGSIQIGDEALPRAFSQDTRGLSSFTINPAAAAFALGNGMIAEGGWEDSSFYLLIGRMLIPEVRRRSTLKATFRGRYHYDLYRAELVTSFPIEPGQGWQTDHLRFTIDEIYISQPGVLRFGVTAERFWLPSDVQNDQYFRHGVGDFGWMGVDSAAHRLHCLKFSAGRLDGKGCVLQRRSAGTENCAFSSDNKEYLHPEAMKLAIFHRIRIGSVVIPFEYKDQTLMVQ